MNIKKLEYFHYKRKIFIRDYLDSITRINISIIFNIFNKKSEFCGLNHIEHSLNKL